MSTPARSFAEDIRARTDAQLVDLVLARPDLAHPAPTDLGALAGRAATRASVARALDRLDLRLLRVLEAHLVGALLARPARRLLPGDPRRFAEATARLWTLGLLWGDGDEVRPVRAVGEALPHPARLGPGAAELGVDLPADVAGAVAGLPPAARAVLQQTAGTHWRLHPASAAVSAAAADLVAAGLAAYDGDLVVLPREVGLAVRGGIIAPEVDEPGPPQDARPVAGVDATGAAAAGELVWAVGEVLRRFEVEQPRVLRAGGLSVRDHKAVTGWLDTTAEHAAFVLEVAAAAGLIAPDGEADPAWLPTHGADRGADADPAARWAALALAWWRSPRAPSLAGTRGEDGSVLNVLGPDLVRPLMRARRQDVCRVLADLPEGVALDEAGIETRLRWAHPVRLPGDVPTHAAEVLREARWLGVVAGGALTAPGRAIATAAEDEVLDAAAGALRAHLPEPVDEVLLQADLTAVAPGPLQPDLDGLMHSLADVESRGGATVFRFTAATLRRGLDAGMDADEIRARLTAASLTPMPQSLDYLIGDAARRHGQARVGAVAAYLRSDDPVLLETLLGEPALRLLQLRRIAPTVLVSPTPATSLLARLREAGHPAVAETSDGGVVVQHRDLARAPDPGRAAGVHVQAPTAQGAADLVAALRRHRPERPAEGPERIPSTDPSATVALLLDAAADATAVWIGYADGTGGPRRVLVRPQQVTGGRLLADAEGEQRTQSYALHRITGVVPAS